MNEFEIRLECLKLAHRHDREAPEIVKRAKEFEAYVNSPAEKPAVEPKPPGTQGFPFKEKKGK